MLTSRMMENIELRIKKVRPNTSVVVPQYMSEDASGMDLFVAIDHDITLHPRERTLVPTGIAISIPRGYEAQIRPRSGLAIKHGITLLNTPGTIDADYRGEINLIVINLGTEPFVITQGLRLAQMVIAPCVKVRPVLVEELDCTDRGPGGFGHTGV